VPSQCSHSLSLFVLNVFICVVYTLLLGSPSWRGFQERLFFRVFEGGFVGGICIRVFVSVACKVSARFFHRV
jgi:hypothetical protein